MLIKKLKETSATKCIIEGGQELSVRPFTLLSTNRTPVYGGSKGRPAGGESQHQMSRRLLMGSIILTGISHGKHQFLLTYPEVDGVIICTANCKCGYEVEIINFRSYGGTKDLQMKWEKHIGTWKGWV